MKLTVDSSKHIVVKDAYKITDLTKKEFEILLFMCREACRKERIMPDLISI